MVANTWLEGTYSEVYPHIAQNAEGMQRLFKQFSFPGGIPEPCRAGDARLDPRGRRAWLSRSPTPMARRSTIPDLIVACVVGDGEAETGPLATSWHSNKFLNPAPTARCCRSCISTATRSPIRRCWRASPPEELRQPVRRLRLQALSRRGRRSGDHAPADGRDARRGARRNRGDPDARPRARRKTSAPRWPMIMLKTPKGWTGPKEVDGLKTEGFWRSHQVPFSELAAKPGASQAARRVDEELPAGGAVRRKAARLRPKSPRWRPPGERRMSANPHANGGRCMCDLDLPDIANYAVEVGKPGERDAEATAVMGRFLRDVMKGERGAAQFPRVRPRRDGLQPASARVRGDRPRLGRRDASL